jgi:hypothetical protein
MVATSSWPMARGAPIAHGENACSPAAIETVRVARIISIARAESTLRARVIRTKSRVARQLTNQVDLAPIHDQIGHLDITSFIVQSTADRKPEQVFIRHIASGPMMALCELLLLGWVEPCWLNGPRLKRQQACVRYDVGS